jgi:uncharacterized protein
LTLLQGALVFAAAFMAGIVNAIAGGGTLISFPTLVSVGLDPLLANMTSTVGLCTGSMASAYGLWAHTAEVKHRLPRLVAIPLVGGIAGAVLLIRTPSSTFAGLVPFLLLGATALFALQEPLGRAHSVSGAIAWPLLFAIGVYGGYFGAGIGILLLATLGMLGLSDIHEKNVVKNLVAFGINGTAALIFVVRGTFLWRHALVLAVGAVSGGYAGAHLANRLGRVFVRRAVIGIGLGLTVWYFAHPGR